MRILQIGCGNMGAAFLRVYGDFYSEITVVDRRFESERFRVCKSISELDGVGFFDLIILAIKPQDFNGIASKVARCCGKNTKILSIMAMISRATIADKIGVDLGGISRIMPNLGISKNIGVSLALNPSKDKILQEFSSLFGKNGNILIDVEGDEDIDKMTPLTGSGAAYFLLLADVLANFSSDSFGLNGDLSIAVVKNLLKSSLYLCENDDFGSSIAKIASKKGVTQAACDAMIADFENGVKSGMKAGEMRSLEFAEELSL